MTHEAPRPGTRDYVMWSAGAAREHEFCVEGMLPATRELFDCVQVLAQQGRSVESVVRFVVRVFVPEWSFWARVKLAWRVIRGG